MSFRLLLFRSLHFLALVFATISLVCFGVQERKVGKNSCFGVPVFRGLVMPFNRSFSSSHGWTGSSMKWRLMRANQNSNANQFAHISLHFMLDPVQLLEYETGLLTPDCSKPTAINRNSVIDQFLTDLAPLSDREYSSNL